VPRFQAIAQVNTASASTTSSACASSGRTLALKPLKSLTTTDEPYGPPHPHHPWRTTGGRLKIHKRGLMTTDAAITAHSTQQRSGATSFAAAEACLGDGTLAASVISPRSTGLVMAQLLVRNLDDSVKEALRRRALCHGRSMEEEARLILSQAAQAADWVSDPSAPGLGTRMAALFAGLGLDEEMPQWPSEEASPAEFGA
jgi:plasmid stability protein